jgi:hypothetical protein
LVAEEFPRRTVVFGIIKETTIFSSSPSPGGKKLEEKKGGDC